MPRPNLTAEDASANEVLAECLHNRSAAPWGTIVAIFRRLIAATIIKASRRFGEVTADEVDDLIQEVYVQLCADNYRVFRHSRAERPEAVYALVQSVALTTVVDHHRRILAQKRGRTDPLPLEAVIGESEADHRAHAAMERAVLIAEIDQCLCRLLECPGESRVTARDRQIFWLYYRHGLTAKDIARIPELALTESGVESSLYRTVSEVKREFARHAKSAEGVL